MIDLKKRIILTMVAVVGFGATDDALSSRVHARGTHLQSEKNKLTFELNCRVFFLMLHF